LPSLRRPWKFRISKSTIRRISAARRSSTSRKYDRAALARREIHLTLVRFNLGELDIVKNQAGRTNIFLPGTKLPAQKSGGGGNGLANTNVSLPSLNPPAQNTGGGGNSLADFQKQSGFDFTGIDMLNVSIGKLKYIDLNNQQNDREQTVGIDNLVIPNVKSPTDLTGLAADIALHSDGFFDSLVDQKNSGLGILKLIGQ